MTALHLASQLSSGSVVRALIEGGADVNVQDADQWSPLHDAACFNPAAVPVLLETKAEVNQLDFIHQSLGVGGTAFFKKMNIFIE